jgi:hypothetical protein
MRPYHGAVNDELLKIGVGGKGFVHPLPDAAITPAGVSLVDGVPLPVRLGQKPPLGTAAADPDDGFNETPTAGGDAEVNTGAGFQKLRDLFPLFVSQVSVSHATSIPITHQFRDQVVVTKQVC